MPTAKIRTSRDFITLVLKGMAMGAADVVPGVSGGTIAFIAGIYEELINTIGGLDTSLITTWQQDGFSAMWKKLNGNFLLALFVGIGISVFTVMQLANYLLETQPVLVWSFFFGLVIASVLYISRQKETWNASHVASAIIGAVLAYYISTLPPLASGGGLWFIYLCASLAICAMILPGISGAFILVLLGAYKTVSEAVHEFNFEIIAVFVAGAVSGLLAFSKLLRFLLSRFRESVLALLTGFIAGSLNKIWPWKEILETVEVGDKSIVLRESSVLPAQFDGDPQVVYAVGLMLIGFSLIFVLEQIAKKKQS